MKNRVPRVLVFLDSANDKIYNIVVNKKHNKIILVDMDGVLSDFESAFHTAWRKAYPHHPHIPKERRKLFSLREEYPTHLGKEISSIYTKKGFFVNLPVIPEGLEAIRKMDRLKHNVFICTSPISRYENCVREKFEWVANHLGYDWTKKIILTRDKTLIHGDYLIDDKPEPEGLHQPSWTHIIFDAPYNRHVKSKLRITWHNWQEILHL